MNAVSVVSGQKDVAPFCTSVAAWAFCGLFAVLLLWLCVALVRVESERYALLIGMCRDPLTAYVSGDCLAKVQTRTAWYWHLFYALKG